jgi:cell division protein FtsI (penicillin-binding protein 3)
MTEVRKEILWRVKLVYVIIMLMAILVVTRVVTLQAFTPKEEIEALSKQVIKESVIEPVRGDICARDGRVLATSVPYFEVGWDPNCPAITEELFQTKIDSLVQCVATILDEDVNDIRKRIYNARDKGYRYVRFAYSASYDQYAQLRNCPILRRGQFRGGFVYNQRNEREHPFGVLAKRTVGTVRRDGRRGVGLEDSYDMELRGVEGFAIKQKVSGSLWMPINDGNEVDPQDGKSLVTTIDIRIQDVAETALENQLIKHKADHGSAIVMEVETGDILAIANLKRTESELCYEAFNYAVGEASDPGSTFKLASAIVALEDNVIKPDDIIETGKGVYYFYNHKMVDSHEGGFGTITFQQAFEFSSNVGIARVIYDNYKDRQSHFVDRLYRLGLNEKVGIQIRGEAEPLIRYPGDEKWSGISLPQMAIGYEVQLTPLQVLTLYNAIANNGKMLKPRIAIGLSYRGEMTNEYPVEVLNPSICSERTLKIVREMLEGVVLRGTATNLFTKNYSIAGKTGTAQIHYGTANHRQYYQSSFVGYFPAENPKYSCIVTIHDPRKGGYYGNIIAGPVFREISDKIHALEPNMHSNDTIFESNKIPRVLISDKQKLDRTLHLLDVPHDQRDFGDCKWVVPDYKDDGIKYYVRNYSNDLLVPNVVGMGLSDAIKVLEEHDLVVRVSGRGKVIRQEPVGFQPYKKGDVINLILL